MSNVPPLVLVLAGIAAVLTTIISFKTLKDHPVLGNPVIPVCVGLMAFIGLCTGKEAGKALPVIIIPYVTLALALPVTLFLLLFRKKRFKSGRKPSGNEVPGQTKSESVHNRQHSSQSKDEEDVHHDDETND